jgi:sn-glycerol 3-phosphate transport system substrate-binding protein
MKRALIVVLALALSLTACANPRVTVVVVWHSLSGVRERALQGLVDQWNAANRTGSVVVAERRDAALMRNAMLNGKARGAEPALTLATPSLAALLYRNGLARQLDDYITSSADQGGFSPEDRSDLFDFVFRAGRTRDGKTIGVGYGGAARAMFYNRDWLRSEGLDSPPRDLERLATVCGRASDQLRGTQCLISPADAATYADWLYMFGGSLAIEEGGPAFAPQFSSQMSITATARLGIFANAGLIRRALNAQQPRDEFAAGRSLFSFDWTDQLADYRTAVKDGANFEWGIASPPAPAGAGQVGYQGWVWTLTPGDGEREDAAWRFVRWMLEEPQSSLWASRTRELPVRATAVNRLRGRDGLDAASADALIRLARQAIATPVLSGWGCIESGLGDAIAEVFEGRPAGDAMARAQAAALTQASLYCLPRPPASSP